MYAIEKVFKYKDYQCVVILYNMGFFQYRCGYVSVPKEHPLNSIDYSSIDNNFTKENMRTFINSHCRLNTENSIDNNLTKDDMRTFINLYCRLNSKNRIEFVIYKIVSEQKLRHNGKRLA